MPLSHTQLQELDGILRDALRRKMARYHPETTAMPFHTRLLGGDRMALFSFIQSLNTSFGVSIYEPVAKALADQHFERVECQATAGTLISSEAQKTIQRIMNNLITEKQAPCGTREIATIRQVCRAGKMEEIKPTKVDIKLIGTDGTVYLMDIKTVKPNRDGVKQYKRTLLEWAAVTLAQDSDIQVQPLIGIPYNPYHPREYARWTLSGILEDKIQMKVAEELWNFLAGTECYDSLLQIFAQVGEGLREEMNDYFSQHVK